MSPWEMLGLASATTLVLFIAAYFAIGLRQSLRKESEPRRNGMNDLHARVAELEAQQGRMAELEERLDFAERLLAEQRSPTQLPRS